MVPEKRKQASRLCTVIGFGLASPFTSLMFHWLTYGKAFTLLNFMATALLFFLAVIILILSYTVLWEEYNLSYE